MGEPPETRDDVTVYVRPFAQIAASFRIKAAAQRNAAILVFKQFRVFEGQVKEYPHPRVGGDIVASFSACSAMLSARESVA